MSSSPSLLSLHNNYARSLYQWLLNIWFSRHKPHLSHVRAHTGNTDIASTLNHTADHLATASQQFSLPPPSVPVPTLFIDNFLLSGFIESSISSFVDYSLASSASQLLNTCHEPLPPLSLFDMNPPPCPYINAPSSYSAVIQLYARSGQLDTRLSLSNRLKDHHQPWFVFGCPCLEDAHHLFVQCLRFSSLRTFINSISSISYKTPFKSTPLRPGTYPLFMITSEVATLSCLCNVASHSITLLSSESFLLSTMSTST